MAIKPFQKIEAGKYRYLYDEKLILESWRAGGSVFWDFFYDDHCFHETYDTKKEALEQFEKYGLEKIKEGCLTGRSGHRGRGVGL